MVIATNRKMVWIMMRAERKAGILVAGVISILGAARNVYAKIAAAALTEDAVTSSELANNLEALDALHGNALTSKSLQGNGLITKTLQDPDSRELFQAIVACALPAAKSVSVTTGNMKYTFDGGIGLTPNWGKAGGTCAAACQEWVSACVLSELDYTGSTEEISMRGSNAALKITEAEAGAYTVREATYYGNLFTGAKRYACLSPGQTEIPRVCGSSLEDCPVEIDPYSTCADLCHAPSRSGAFTDCKNIPGRQGKAFPDTITIYLQVGEF